MAVQSSLLRCLRTSSLSTATFTRPLAIRSPIFTAAAYPNQRSSYATDQSPSEQSPTEPTQNDTKPRSSIFDTPSPPSSSLASASSEIADANARLSESIASISKEVQFIQTPIASPRANRDFVAHRGLAAARAQQAANKELDDLMSVTRRARQSSQKLQQGAAGVNSTASAIDSADPFSPPKLRTIPMKLGTKLGRQVLVSADRGIDVAGAIRQVQINCAVNGIRRQAALQKFHVRRGQRRKDLKSQRWRKLFKFSFEETVKKIQRMRDQGW